MEKLSVMVKVARALKDPNPLTRTGAAQALNRLGSAGALASPVLIEALDDSVPAVRHEAAEALQKINTPDAQKALRFYPLKERVRSMLHK